MGEEKFRKRVVAITFGAVLLFVILFGFMIYGLVSISVRSHRIDELKEQIAYYKSLTEEEKERADACGEWEYIKQEARKLGYSDPNDID